VLSQAAAEKLGKELLPRWQHERERLDRIDKWYRWEQEPIRLPRKATPELRKLAELSKVPWLGLVVTTVAQAMYVDGYRSQLDDPSAGVDDIPEESPWRIWQANGFDQRQIAIHRAALAYGYSFVTVLPGVNFLGDSEAVMRGVSPRKMYATWDDPAQDDWPNYAMQVEVNGDKSYDLRLYDETHIYRLQADSQMGKVSYVGEQVHDVGVVPVIRYCNELDLDGRTPGEIEPHIPLANRINKTSYDRMLVQHFNGWKVRTVVGMAEPDTEEEANRKKLSLRQDDLLVAEDPDTKFGSLDETPLEGFIAAWRADIEALAAVSQTPTHELTGQLANLSAEALAAARAAHTQKTTERQKTIGKSHVQALRLAALVNGADDYARDVTGRVTWQDTEIRSMSQAVDALGKAAQMLGVPVKALWGRIPGVERSDVEEWAQMAMEGDPIMQMRAELERQASAPAPAPDNVPAGDGRY
jgi:hypothetical protein